MACYPGDVRTQRLARPGSLFRCAIGAFVSVSSAALVERMLDLHEKLAAAAIPADKAWSERQIKATDRRIDALVYELYGLTKEEIAIVEAAGA